ncbi:MAG: cation:proton antiporter [Rhodobacteraceae bacterium]|nr:MAG: cation:proton antiporter [Paracoccaceae bacterium]
MTPPDLPLILIGFGAVFFVGLIADWAGRHSPLPRVTLLLLAGLVVGRAGLDLMPDALVALYGTISIVALTMVAFLLGGALSVKVLRSQGRAILVTSLAVVGTSFTLVAGGLAAMGTGLSTALVLGAIACATAPAATLDVIRQSRIDNAFTRRVSGIVAIDDVWGLVVFSLAIVAAQSLEGMASDAGVLREAAREIGGSVALGLIVGLPAAYLTGRLSRNEPLRIEALGLVFLTAGAALMFEVSFLLAGMIAGAVIVNLARHHTRAFHEIEGLQWPFSVVFFILAGAGLELASLMQIGALGAAYVGLRVLSRIAGAVLGSVLLRDGDRRGGALVGAALMPQAGVAIGMALVAASVLPGQAETIMAVTIGSTVLFELLGPPVTAWAIRKSARDQASAAN